MTAAKIKWLLYVMVLLLTAGCGTSSNSGHVLSPSLTGSVQNNPINTEQIQNFSRSVRPIDGELDAKYNLATHFQRIRQHRLALQVLDEIIQQAPGHARAHNAMGYSYDCIGAYPEAQDHYRRAIALAPDMDQAYNNLGFSYILSKEFAAAIEVLKQAITLNEDNIKYHKNLGLAYFQNGDVDLAALTFERVKDTVGLAASGEKPGRTITSLTTVIDASPEPAAARPLNEIDRGAQSAPAPGEQNASTTLIPSVEKQIQVDPIQMPRIEIANGNGITGMAKSVADYLSKKGIDRCRLTNAGHFGYGTTVIYYRDGYHDQALQIKNLLPGLDGQNRLVETQLVREPIRILIGKDLNSVESRGQADTCVDISNGNGIPGMAKRVGKHIAQEGFRVGRLSNADHFKYPRTTIFFSKGQAQQARLVAGALPDSIATRLVELTNTDRRIQIRLGSDYTF